MQSPHLDWAVYMFASVPGFQDGLVERPKVRWARASRLGVTVIRSWAARQSLVPVDKLWHVKVVFVRLVSKRECRRDGVAVQRREQQASEWATWSQVVHHYVVRR